MQNLSVSDIISATGGTLVSGSDEEIIHNITIDSRKADKNVLFVPL